MQGCNDPAKQEYVGRLLKRKGEWNLGNVVGRVSQVSSSRAEEEVCIIVGEAWKGYIRKWKEGSSRSMYVRMKIGIKKYVIVGSYGSGSQRKKEEHENFWSDLGEVVGVLRGMG